MKSIAISSGKGGVGKTTLAVNLGLALGELGKRVLLVDADLGLANIDIMAGISVRRTLADSLGGEVKLSDLFVDLSPSVKLLPASSGMLALERLSRSERDAMGRKLLELQDLFDVMFFDTGAGITENVLFFDALADEVLLVTTPEPTSVTDTYALIKILALHHHISAVSLLVNRTLSIAEGIEVHRKLSGVCQHFLQTTVSFAGQLLKDNAVERAIRDRQPFVMQPQATAVKSNILALASRFDQVFHAPHRELEKAILQVHS